MYYPHCWITADLLILVDRLRYVLPSLLDHSRSTHLGGPVEICTTLTVGSQQIYCGGPVEICTTLTVGSQQIYSSWWTGWDMYYPHCWITSYLLWWIGWDMYNPHCWITADLLILVDRLRYVLSSLLDHSRSTHLGGPVEVCTTLTVGSQQIYCGGPVEICTTLTVGSQQIYSWWTGWDMYYPHCWITWYLLWWIGWDMYYPHCWITADLL